MTLHTDRNSRIARVLAAHAMRVAQPDHSEWTKAMIYEQEYLPPDASALSWALGSVFVSYRRRLRATIRSPHLSRCLLLTTLLLCLGPACAYSVFVAVSTAQGYLLFPLPYTVIQEGLICGSATFIGPIGVAAALWTLSSPAHRPGTKLISVLWLLTIWALAVCLGLVNQYAVLLHVRTATSDILTLLAPFVLLPGLAVTQLQWLAARGRRKAALAGA